MGYFSCKGNLNWQKLIVIASLLVVFCLVVSYAGVRQDSNGNKITQDIVAPGGGGLIVNGNGSNLNCSVGQVAVGVSTSPSGSTLIHGVYTFEIQETNPSGWIMH